MPGLEDFALPEALIKDETTASGTYAKFLAEPFENGFGHTLGNALRRVLLSSMDGVAVTSLRIDGVDHEFSSIQDVAEDVTEIVLRVKKIRIETEGELPRTLELSVEKAGPITAGMIQEDGVTTVLNPELVICTLDKDRPLRIEFVIDRGRGYRPVEENKNEDQPIGIIPIASLFSPVERVRYDVQACRVGNRTDYDKLELEIWTDGRIDPEAALTRSSQLLREHLGVFVSGEEQSSAPAPVAIMNEEDRALVDSLMVPVNDLELSIRAVNCLNTAQIRVLGELVGKAEAEMLKFRNFGKKSLNEIKEKLKERDLGLGMAIKEEILDAVQRLLSEQEEDCG
ncbi:MAG: DNA-directed RNA polymerase subunit alpha [Lentisphaeria bacterium]|nr:DNA-directed RNA polymerase subunit alpha [Lentisphaeria bacterium]